MADLKLRKHFYLLYLFLMTVCLQVKYILESALVLNSSETSVVYSFVLDVSLCFCGLQVTTSGAKSHLLLCLHSVE